VLKGKDIIRTAENTTTGQNDKPEAPWTVVDCGEILEGAADGVSSVDAYGDQYPSFPDDFEGKKEAPELLVIAGDIKNYGNAAFKQGKYEDAIRKYTKAVRYLQEKPAFDEDDDPALPGQFQALKVPLYLNRAACFLKTTSGAPLAERDTTYVIEMEGVQAKDLAKAYYRRGCARVAKGNEEGAVKDLQEARRIGGEDPGVIRELEGAKKRLDAQKAKQRKAYSKMFG
jgi:peptidyl-prolyl isomerase D